MRTTEVAALVGAGLVGGFVNSVAGGGSLLLFPALIGSELSTLGANVTTSVALWPGYLGTLAGLGARRADLRRVAALLTVAALGAIGGCVLLLRTPSATFDVVVPFLVLGAAALILAQPVIATRVAARRDAPGRKTNHTWLWLAVGAGSVYGGYFGGGLGVILMAVLGLTMTGPLHATNMVKGLLQATVGTAALIVFALFAPVSWAAAGIAAPAALAGGVVGGRITRLIDEQVLRIAVAGFGLAIGCWLAYRAFAR